MNNMSAGPILNLYPDSLGGRMENVKDVLDKLQFENTFETLYILPSIFNTDLDRGFSVIDYDLNSMFTKPETLKAIKEKGIKFKFDLIMNHASVLSKQFQDLLEHGEESQYKDFFINWNEFWQGLGQITEDGIIQPDEKYIKDMYFRKPGLPLLSVRMKDGKEIPYWNTFYQEVKYNKIDIQDLMKAMNLQYATSEAIVTLVNSSLEKGNSPKQIDFGELEVYKEAVIEYLESRRKYLGQMDLNVNSPLVWEFYSETLKKLTQYGAEIVRLDAFAYASKEPGERNFFNEPGTWNLLERLNNLAKENGIRLLPEIHSKYEEMIHEKISENGYMTYDFFLPGLIIDALERHTNEVLIKWINDIENNGIKTVNMLGCHDGIPLLDLKGLLTDEQIQNLIDIVVSRGGYVKDLHGKNNIYYQVNATYFSALGEDEKKLLLARAIQLFMPGKPQIWYLDLFAGTNDYEAVKNAGSGGHKEINRTNLSTEFIEESLKRKIVSEQLDLIKFRNEFPAFGFDSKLTVIKTEPHILKLCWEKNEYQAVLTADLKNYHYNIQSQTL